jgi:DNA-binding FrmR family transcriptional regulator
MATFPNGETMAKKGKYPSHKDQLSRLKRIEGQVRGIQKMIEDGRYCVDIITQLESITSAIAGLQEQILRRHLEHCVTTAMQGGSEADKQEKITEIIGILKNFRR